MMKTIKFVEGGKCCDCIFHSESRPFCDLSQHDIGDVFSCVECSVVHWETIYIDGHFILEDEE